MYVTTLNFELFDILKLENDIKEKSISLNSKLDGLVYNNSNNELMVMSLLPLDEADISNIEEVIANYNNTLQEKDTKIIGLGLQNVKVSNTEYTSVFVYDYKPRSDLTLKQVIIRSFCTNTEIAEPEYSIRIVNVTHNEIIGENTFTNLHSNECCLDIINATDIHTSFRDVHALEIQVKINHIKSVLTILSASLILEYN